MAIAIAEYTGEFTPAVKAFNGRLQRGGVRYQFPETSSDDDAGAPIAKRGFVAVQDGRDVRGGYLLKEQDFWLNGEHVRLGYIHLPLSEGLIDRAYSTLALQLMAHAIKRQPLLFGLGMGGYDETFVRIVSALGWQLTSVPFFFCAVRPFRIARGLTHVRRTRSRRLLLDAAAWTGAASLAGACARVLRRPATLPPDYVIECVETFDVPDDRWLDDVWASARADYHLIGRRDRSSLPLMYAHGGRPFLRYRLSHRGAPVGWAVALDTQMAGHKHFGDLRVATIVDGLTGQQHLTALVAGVSRHLADRHVDLIVSNHSAAAWADAFNASGFHRGPSNYLFAASPRLAKALTPLEQRLGQMHLTRGDGDGPINL